MKIPQIPTPLVLTESRKLRLFAFTLLYVAQGIPFGLVNTALPAYLAETGESPAVIASFIAIANLPWSFKLLAGPIMDRWTFLPMGRRRPWVILAQSLMVLTGAAFLLFPDGLSNVALLSALCFSLNVFGASQDVAVDGMAIDVLPAEEHGQANSFMAFGQVTGISLSTIVSAFVVITFGMTGIAAMLCLAFGLVLVIAVLVRERPSEKLLPWTPGKASQRSVDLKPHSWKVITFDLIKVIFLPTSLLIFAAAFVFRFAHGMWISITPIVVLQDLGFESRHYSPFISGVGFIAALVGLSFGLLIDKKGVRLFYCLSLGLCGLLCIFIGLTQSLWDSVPYLVTVGTLQAFFYQGGFISFIASCMKLCWQKVSATQFAIYMAGANIGLSMGAGAYASVESLLTADQIFLVLGLVFFLGVLVVSFTNFEKHYDSVEGLDKPDKIKDFAPQR